MKTKYALLKLAVLMFGLATVHALAPASAGDFCPPFAVFCTTDTSAGHCGFQTGIEDCRVCYGNDGSVQFGNPDCRGGLVRATN